MFRLFIEDKNHFIIYLGIWKRNIFVGWMHGIVIFWLFQKRNFDDMNLILKDNVVKSADTYYMFHLFLINRDILYTRLCFFTGLF
jgi:hypothetical protein